MKHAIIIRASTDETLFIPSQAAHLAGVSRTFLDRCQQQGLIKSKLMTGGGIGYDIQAVRQLARIRRLYVDLDLDLETIDVVLHLREQILDLQEQLHQLEHHARQREHRLQADLLKLRRLLFQQGRQP